MSAPPIVIIAEPDPMISSVLRVEFSHSGFAALLATSGPEAEEFAAHTVAHLVVLDTRLRMAAYAACAGIRRRKGYTKRPIVLTGNDVTPLVQEAAILAGATVLLRKPYSVSDLIGAITPSLPEDDLLLTHRAPASGMHSAKAWMPPPPPILSGSNSALARNAQLLPIVRGKGVTMPLVRLR